MAANFSFWIDVWPLFLGLFEIFKGILLYPFPATRRSLQGEVALITGAGSGLGRGMAYLLAKKGCVVVCWDVNAAGNDETVKHINEELGKEAYGFIVDVTDREAVYKAAHQSALKAGDITLLINNAGIVSGRSFLELDDKVIEKVMAVNTMSHFWTTKAFLPSMIEKDHGQIVAIASSAGYFAVPKLTDYCASKAAAAHFADSLDMELKKQGSNVKVTWVCPYAIDTGMFAGFESRQAWLVNVLKPDYVIEKTVDAIQTGASQVLLPGILNHFLLVGCLIPRKAYNLLAKWSGIEDCMNNFTGRAPPAKKSQ